ncbi:efflux transporter outer membrane subunit [Hydrogenophaga sp. BPS33]|uniref:efflux transporter outer membrane subunit n=1 Tax=Hydrogenophaga sp. BPS33 TaxID=2651974 RepID=UPI0013203404|nr:efflux transporter outer membrane subunit [Hydrogenophaga sp. BPS33]QHE85531.1 efflux transporter outer membrane subunit [Hydrogenophaga sp. BPS33]
MKPHQTTDVRGRFQRRGIALSIVVAALVAGCASSAGIQSQSTALEPQAVGLAPSGVGSGAAMPAADWWRTWGDEELGRVIEQALRAQPSLGVAQARLRRAQAATASEEATNGLQVKASADATRQRFSANSIYPAPLGGSMQTMANAQIAGSWELDFFGKHRSAIEAALGAERAAAADVQAARNLLASQVAQTYVQLGRLLAQREVAQQALAQREQMLGLIRQRVDAGLDTRVELKQGEGALPDARVQIEQVDEQIAAARHALAALAALPPQSYDQLQPNLQALRSLPLPAVLPADLLGRRADITAARWRIEAATQGVSVAKAQFYPNVSLTAFVGLASIGLDRLVDSGSQQYGIGPAVHLPLFDTARLRAQLRVRTADLDAAVDSYNGAVLEAVRDTADQLNARQSLERQREQQAQARSAAEAAYDIATQRYQAGLSNYLTVLTAEATLFNQRRQTIDLQARALSTQVALVRALGGGFAPDAVH